MWEVFSAFEKPLKGLVLKFNNFQIYKNSATTIENGFS